MLDHVQIYMFFFRKNGGLFGESVYADRSRGILLVLKISNEHQVQLILVMMSVGYEIMLYW